MAETQPKLQPALCQCSPSSYDDGAADGTASLAGHKVRALVRGEAASSASVPARSADNGPGIHVAKNRRCRINQRLFPKTTPKCCHRWRRLPLSNDFPPAFPGGVSAKAKSTGSE